MANVNCDGAVRMCRAARVTIHQRQQIVINKAQLKARGRADRQAATACARLDDGEFTFQRMLKPFANPYLIGAARADARANDIMSCY